MSCNTDDVDMNGRIIVGYDGSKESAKAVAWAANEARSRCSPLEVLTFYELPPVGDVAYPSTRALTVLVEDAQALSADILQVIQTRHPQVTVCSAISAGPPALALSRVARSDDLIVVGSSRHEGVAASLLGSTASHLVRHARCPVAVVRGVNAGNQETRVVVGVDGSDNANVALRWAADEAGRLRIDLTIVHAWTYPHAVTDVPSARARDVTRVDAGCILDRAVEVARESTTANVTEVLIESGPVSALTNFVAPTDLLVLGSRGQGAVRSALFGSTVSSMLEHSVATVVVVPHEAASGCAPVPDRGSSPEE
jgi:nucleotide-binding universal stress UspA family protein